MVKKKAADANAAASYDCGALVRWKETQNKNLLLCGYSSSFVAML